MAFEAKWNPTRLKKLPMSFREAYPESEYFVVNPENYMHFLTNVGPAPGPAPG